MARISVSNGQGITTALLTGQAEETDGAELDGTVEVDGSYDQHYQPANGARFTRCDGGARAGKRGLPASLRTSPLVTHQATRGK